MKKRMSEAVVEGQMEARMDKLEDELNVEASGLFANYIDLDPPEDPGTGRMITLSFTTYTQLSLFFILHNFCKCKRKLFLHILNVIC